MYVCVVCVCVCVFCVGMMCVCVCECISIWLIILLTVLIISYGFREIFNKYFIIELSGKNSNYLLQNYKIKRIYYTF